jgi:putative restriction endonuclease
VSNDLAWFGGTIELLFCAPQNEPLGMSSRKRWTRDELLVALNLYEKIPFGHFDEDQPVIRDVAKRMNRTPGSLAMKLANLASLDPATHARGRKGLPGAANRDRDVWKEFQGNRDALAPVSEELLRALFNVDDSDEVDLVKGIGVVIRKASVQPVGPTEAVALVKVRRGQQFFQQMVLNAFDSRCGITGIAIRRFLVASHILPWSSHPAERLNPQNGVCLSRLHDGAFDAGLITFDSDLRLVLGKELRDAMANETLQRCFVDFEGKRLNVPNNSLPPKPEFFAFHREHLFRG